MYILGILVYYPFLYLWQTISIRLRWLNNKPYLPYGFFYVLFAGTFFPLHCIIKRGGVYSAELTPLPLTLCIASGIVVSSKTERFGKGKKVTRKFLLKNLLWGCFFPSRTKLRYVFHIVNELVKL